MNRRELFRVAISWLPVLLVPRFASALPNDSPSRQASIAGWSRRIRAILDRGRLPIIDTQATYFESQTNVPLMIERMNELDIAQIAFATFDSPTGRPSLDLHLKYPEYFIPTTSGGESKRWERDPAAFVAGFREELKSGDYYFMGEYEFRHYPSPQQVKAGRWDRDVSIDITGPAGHALFGLSAEFDVAFQIHYEIEDRLLAPLESMLERYPKAKVIWCHLGQIRYPDRAQRYNAEYIGGLIERFPGLHFDLAVAPPGSVYKPSGARHSTLYSSSGQLDKRWQALMEKRPERFLAASDYRIAVEQNYPEQIARQRNLILQALSERTRHLVAYGNAWRLITGTPWSS